MSWYLPLFSHVAVTERLSQCCEWKEIIVLEGYFINYERGALVTSKFASVSKQNFQGWSSSLGEFFSAPTLAWYPLSSISILRDAQMHLQGKFYYLSKSPFQWQLHVRKNELWWWCKLGLLLITDANMCWHQKFSSDVRWIGQDMNFVSQLQLRRVSCNRHSSTASRGDISTPPVVFQMLWRSFFFHIRTGGRRLLLLFSGSKSVSFLLCCETDVPSIYCVYLETCKGFLGRDVL